MVVLVESRWKECFLLIAWGRWDASREVDCRTKWSLASGALSAPLLIGERQTFTAQQ